jgi:uncharacterized membrane protein YjgN (DUF898 family)
MTGSAHAYASKAFGLNILMIVSLGVLAPYVIAKKWNLLMNEASFGSQQVTAQMSPAPLYKRALITAGFLVAFISAIISIRISGAESPSGIVILIAIVSGIAFYAYAYSFYALVWREKINALRWGNVEFYFGARTLDWFLFLLVIGLLTPFTLGILYLFVPILFWKFVCRHLTLSGDPNPALEQSQTALPGMEEGVSEALDMGGLI